MKIILICNGFQNVGDGNVGGIVRFRFRCRINNKSWQLPMGGKPHQTIYFTTFFLVGNPVENDIRSFSFNVQHFSTYVPVFWSGREAHQHFAVAPINHTDLLIPPPKKNKHKQTNKQRSIRRSSLLVICKISTQETLVVLTRWVTKTVTSGRLSWFKLASAWNLHKKNISIK